MVRLKFKINKRLSIKYTGALYINNYVNISLVIDIHMRNFVVPKYEIPNCRQTNHN